MEGIRNMYYVYARMKADEIRSLREAQMAEGNLAELNLESEEVITHQ